MNVLITGSDGFIGGALCKAFSEQYPESVVFKFEARDVQNMIGWRVTLESYVKNSDCIFHIGAISSTDVSNVNSVMFFNYQFSKMLFDLAQKYNKRVVYSSSAATYGNGNGIPSTLYAWSKAVAEDYGLLAVDNFVSLRYFNVYGPGESHKGHMASVAYQAWGHSKQSKEPFQLLPGHPKRDFVYIKDVVAANLFSLQNNVESGKYDVGSGVSEPFEKILQILDIQYTYKDESAIPSWYQFLTMANKKKFLPGWEPKYNLTQGLIDYLSYLS